jgi:hypothetical protein
MIVGIKMFKQYRINKIKCKLAEYESTVNELNNIGRPSEHDGMRYMPTSVVYQIIDLKGKIAYLDKKLSLLEGDTK